MPETILIIAAGPLQIPAIEEAHRMGLRVVAVDSNPAAPGLAMADVSLPIDLADVKAIEAVARQERISGVTSLCTDFAVWPTAYIAQALGLPGMDADAARNVTDKRRMRRCFATAGAPSPVSFEASDVAEAAKAAASIGYPVAVKAPRSAGSRGVSRSTSDRDLADCVELARRYEKEGPILIEEWVEGPEVSVEGVCVDEAVHIVQVTDKSVFASKNPVESGHTQPSRLPPADVESIKNATAAGARALGLRNCGFHAELKVNQHGARIIEIAARLGGDRIATHLTPLSTGVDLVRATIDVALGHMPSTKPVWDRGSAVRYFFSAQTGILEAVEGLDAVREMPGLELLFAGSERDGLLRPGLRIPPILSSLDRYGHVIFSGATADEAADRAEGAVNSLVFRISALVCEMVQSDLQTLDAWPKSPIETALFTV